LDWALADFSGYLVLDEMYDGPFCVLCAVDGPKQRRLLYDVLDHDPDHDDIRRFLRRLQQTLAARNTIVHGITNKRLLEVGGMPPSESGVWLCGTAGLTALPRRGMPPPVKRDGRATPG
jgi:hypothetical protein